MQAVKAEKATRGAVCSLHRPRAKRHAALRPGPPRENSFSRGSFLRISRTRGICPGLRLSAKWYFNFYLQKMQIGHAVITIRSGGVYAARRKILERSLPPRKNFSFRSNFTAVPRSGTVKFAIREK